MDRDFSDIKNILWQPLRAHSEKAFCECLVDALEKRDASNTTLARRTVGTWTEVLKAKFGHFRGWHRIEKLVESLTMDVRGRPLVDQIQYESLCGLLTQAWKEGKEDEHTC